MKLELLVFKYVRSGCVSFGLRMLFFFFKCVLVAHLSCISASNICGFLSMFRFCGQTESSCVTVGWIYDRRPALLPPPPLDLVLFVLIFCELITW